MRQDGVQLSLRIASTDWGELQKQADYVVKEENRLEATSIMTAKCTRPEFMLTPISLDEVCACHPSDVGRGSNHCERRCAQNAQDVRLFLAYVP